MSVRIRIKGAKAAIWTGASNTIPFDNPRAAMSRVKFHTDLDYVQIVSTLSGVLSLPSRAGAAIGGSHVLATHNGPAHGRAGNPIVLGYMTIGGQRIAFAGSVLVQYSDSNYARLASLGANGTRILFHEQTDIGDSSSIPALSIPYSIFVTNENV